MTGVKLKNGSWTVEGRVVTQSLARVFFGESTQQDLDDLTVYWMHMAMAGRTSLENARVQLAVVRAMADAKNLRDRKKLIGLYGAGYGHELGHRRPVA